MAALPGGVRDELWGRARVRTGDAGETLVMQGDPTGLLHVLLMGEATSTCVAVTGRRVVTARWLAPSVIDKVTMFAESRHPASVALDTLAMWCTIPFVAVREAVSANPAAQGHALAKVAAAARLARTSFIDVAIRSSAARLARWLVMTTDLGVPITVPSPQERLALQLGMTRVTLNRLLHDLVARGMIEVEGSTVSVVDPGRLRDLAGF